jgi:predicted secreted hydrolase
VIRRHVGLPIIMSMALIAPCNAATPPRTGAPGSQRVDAMEEQGPPGPARDADGYRLADRPVAFEFPREHGPHPQFRQEWWYVAGNLTGLAAERFGFELTFFRVALVAPSQADAAVASEANGVRHSDWRADQLFLAHFAITDVQREKFTFAQKVERGALGLAGAQAVPFQVWLDDWQIAAITTPAGLISAGAPSAGPQTSWTLHAQQQHYELELQVQPLSGPVLNGDRGLSVKGNEPGAASYYYSIPRLAVRGKLIRDGAPIAVTGGAWLDREWGGGVLGSDEAGWDWYALQLDDGASLMFYTLRKRDGSREPHSAGTWVDRNGVTQALTSDDVDIEVADHWLSPRGARYPSHWYVRVPKLSLNLEVTPVLKNQELETAPPYWEGAVNVKGALDARSLGRGYVELVGY